ncbi:MAG: hypothetical protein CSA81_09680 [Acidobacteria bacterium]|nr:MAG: hypothetical protein CSA81_09680 [Acidobacteriota bacterium]
MTEKLYLNDSTQMEFKSTVSEITEYRGKPAIVLKETLFYGEAGGQLADHGRLQWHGGAVDVCDVQIEEQTFYHLVESIPEGLTAGSDVVGKVDAQRRWDHMRQHTGQHLVSAAFYTVEGIKTISSRLGSRVSTIDINIEKPDWELARRIEQKVNQTIMENRPIVIHYPNAAELATMKMRRTPKVDRDIRVIEIADMDLTPCGGTHCRTTGEVGFVKIISLERYKGMIRVTFVAGQRALDVIQSMSSQVRTVVSETECQLSEIPNMLSGLHEELKETKYKLGVMRKAHLARIAEQLLSEHAESKGLTVILTVQEQLDAEARRVLASALSARSDVVSGVFSRDIQAGKWMIVMEAAPQTGVQLQKLFKEFFFPKGGRGGGRAQHVEGFLPDQDVAIEEVLEELKTALTGH